MDTEIICCCANCEHADGKRLKNNKIRCKIKHEYMSTDYCCDIDYDYGNNWYGIIGEPYND